MLLVGLLMLVATPVSAQSDQPQQLTEGVTVVDLTPGDVREVRFTVDSATAAVLSWSCSFCEVEVSETDSGLTAETHGGNMLSVHADQNGGLTATISSDSTSVSNSCCSPTSPPLSRPNARHLEHQRNSPTPNTVLQWQRA